MNDQSTPIANLCGTNIPTQQFSDGDAMFLLFNGGSQPKMGFRLKYSAGKQGQTSFYQTLLWGGK